MRLIDLDKFLDDFYGNDVCPKAIIPLAKERIEKKKQELFKKYGVDAIPIERLEQEIDRYIDLGLNSVAKELRTIVDDWRKENESNSNS